MSGPLNRRSSHAPLCAMGGPAERHAVFRVLSPGHLLHSHTVPLSVGRFPEHFGGMLPYADDLPQETYGRPPEETSSTEGDREAVRTNSNGHPSGWPSAFRTI